MQFRTRGTPEQIPPNHPRPDAALSPAMTAVAGGARRRALRDGDRRVDTAHLLHSLVESDDAVRDVFGGAPQLARVLGYLVQRSIGYGLRWQGAREASGAVPVVRTPTGEGWSSPAAEALERAARGAARRGRSHADGLDLLAALLADPRCRAVEVLERAGVEVAELASRTEARLTAGETPW
ncbi:peptidase [Streptomyces sp. NBC_01341]|uniref:Clp protease N-terminal domain-containing protein n=1 Tax=Streptomyces sp. NBC_01341 TaxID=2903831 RepID=UPI002E165CCC|nr:peptidase [Streptomyces sp. NBC_01341]